MNRLGFILLSILGQNGAEELGMKENTIFKKVQDFEQSGYIGRGLKEGRANTFFITEDGLSYLEKERGNKS